MYVTRLDNCTISPPRSKFIEQKTLKTSSFNYLNVLLVDSLREEDYFKKKNVEFLFVYYFPYLLCCLYYGQRFGFFF